MRNIALSLCYEGTAYHGWQVQKNAVTVAGTLEAAAAKVLGHRVHITGCGRTDAGVHAKRYNANFHTDSRIPAERISSTPTCPRTSLFGTRGKFTTDLMPSAPAAGRNTRICCITPASGTRFMSTAPGFTPGTWTRT